MHAVIGLAPEEAMPEDASTAKPERADSPGALAAPEGSQEVPSLAS